MELKDKVTAVKGVGPKMEEKLGRLGGRSDFLFSKEISGLDEYHPHGCAGYRR